MKIPRELFYKDREKLDDFFAGNEGLLNRKLYSDWLLKRPELKPGEGGYQSRLLATFNDAYCICTLIPFIPSKKYEYWLSYYESITKLPSVVIPLVYGYLSLNKDQSNPFELLLTVIETECKLKGWDECLEEIKQVVKKRNLVSPDFKRRPYDSTFLSTINWHEVVEGFYKADNTRKIITLLAQKEEEGQMIADAIVTAAKADEDEFYNPTEPIPDDEYDWDYCSEPDDNYDPCPDYTAIYRLHSQIVNKESQLLSANNSQDKKKVNKVAPTRQLKELLNGTWFNDFSQDKVKYTRQWREELVDELMRSDFDYDIALQWKKKKKYNKILTDRGFEGRRRIEWYLHQDSRNNR